MAILLSITWHLNRKKTHILYLCKPGTRAKCQVTLCECQQCSADESESWQHWLTADSLLTTSLALDIIPIALNWMTVCTLLSGLCQNPLWNQHVWTVHSLMGIYRWGVTEWLWPSKWFIARQFWIIFYDVT